MIVNKVFSTSRLGLIVIITLVSDFLNPVFSQEKNADTTILDLSIIERIMIEKIPSENREEIPQQYMQELFDDLQAIDIHTVSDLNNFIDTYIEETINIEEEICKQIIDRLNDLNPDHTYADGEVYLSADVITGTYAADGDEEEIELIKQGIFFTPLGLVCTMIDLYKCLREDEVDNSEN